MIRCVWSLIACCLLFAALPAFAQADNAPGNEPDAPTQPAATPDRSTLEKQFAEKLSGCVFHGSYSVTGRENNPPQMEKYTISKVTKLKDDYWQFEARVQYGKHDITVPMILEVKWAGDTPMITLTDLTIPGLGTFTSRVLIHGDRYAGTWQHGKAGGHLWGKIEKAPANNGAAPGDNGNGK